MVPLVRRQLTRLVPNVAVIMGLARMKMQRIDYILLLDGTGVNDGFALCISDLEFDCV